MLALDARPQLASRARVADRSAHVTWQLLEAEDGAPQGDAQIRRPESAWTAELRLTTPSGLMPSNVRPVVGSYI